MTLPDRSYENLNSLTLRLAQDICMHLADNGDPCNECLIRSSEYLEAHRTLKHEIRQLVARWRIASDLLQDDTMNVMARDLERLLHEDS